MKRSKAKFLVLGLGLMILYSGLATVDLWRLRENPAWSGFQKFRIKTHLEVISLTTVVVPPIGPLALVHHGGRLLDAYVDQHEAPAYTMRYLRGLVMEAPDCQEKVTAHEKAYKQGRSGRHGTITCEVPFVLGTGDSFSIYVYSERNGNEVTTAFLVHGLGLSPTTEKQSPMYLFRGVPEPWKGV